MFLLVCLLMVATAYELPAPAATNDTRLGKATIVSTRDRTSGCAGKTMGARWWLEADDRDLLFECVAHPVTRRPSMRMKSRAPTTHV